MRPDHRAPGPRRVFLAALLLLPGLGACAPRAPGPAASPQGKPGLFVTGYHPWWSGDEDHTYPPEVLDQLFYFEIEAGPDGEILDSHGWPEGWSGLRERARRAGLQVVPTVTMHDPQAFESVFRDSSRSERLLEAVMAILRADPSLRGIHLDLEVFQPVSPEARDGYTAFVAALDRRLAHEDPGLGLSVFLLAFDDADAYNERALAEIADWVVVQGYDFHARGGERAGPVAALRGWGRLSWEAMAQRFDSLGVPRERMVLGAPLYGYEWPTDSPEAGAATRGEGRAVPLAAPEAVLPELPRARERAGRHGVRRDPASGSPYYTFQDADGGWWQGWYDDEESLAEKIRFVREGGYGGIAFFPLSYGDDQLWRTLAPLLRSP